MGCAYGELCAFPARMGFGQQDCAEVQTRLRWPLSMRFAEAGLCVGPSWLLSMARYIKVTISRTRTTAKAITREKKSFMPKMVAIMRTATGLRYAHSKQLCSVAPRSYTGTGRSALRGPENIPADEHE